MFKPAPDALPPQHGMKRYFFIPKFCFAAIGIDPTSLKRTIFSQFLVWIPMMSLLTLCVPFLWFVGLNIGDLDVVTDVLAIFMQSLLSFFKLFYFVYNRKKIVQLVRKIWLWNLEANNEEFKIISEENRIDSMISIFFYTTVFVTGVMALTAPLVIAFIYYLKGYTFWDNLVPPLKAVYPVDPKTYLGYIYAYLWNTSGIYYVLNGTLSTDTLFSWFMHNVVAQFRIVNLRFKDVAEYVKRVKHGDGDDDDDGDFRKCLIQGIKYHRRVIELSDDFNDVFMVTVFSKFTISFLQIACLAFQFARGGELATQIFHLFFLVSVSLQMMLYCYGGQRIKDESASVAVVIYDCFKWHEMSTTSKKLLLLPLARAQKPCIITGAFFVVDLSLFLWVYKTAFSFITLFITMEEKEI